MYSQRPADWDNVSFVEDPDLDEFAEHRHAVTAAAPQHAPAAAARRKERRRRAPAAARDDGYDDRLVCDWISAQNPGLKMPATPGGGDDEAVVFVDPVNQSMLNAQLSLTTSTKMFPPVKTTYYGSPQRSEPWPPRKARRGAARGAAGGAGVPRAHQRVAAAPRARGGRLLRRGAVRVVRGEEERAQVQPREGQAAAGPDATMRERRCGQVRRRRAVGAHG
ncbi:hypothetical protein JL722_14920 [Aureococcus anophagefferens]|nr:hypothetical protein JL722_14920 [Aureococcus anophagefferens]